MEVDHGGGIEAQRQDAKVSEHQRAAAAVGLRRSKFKSGRASPSSEQAFPAVTAFPAHR